MTFQKHKRTHPPTHTCTHRTVRWHTQHRQQYHHIQSNSLCCRIRTSRSRPHGHQTNKKPPLATKQDKKKMGAGQSGSSRTVTIENENPLVDVSEAVVSRLRGQLAKGKNKSLVHNLTFRQCVCMELSGFLSDMWFLCVMQYEERFFFGRFSYQKTIEGGPL